ncbi:MAG: carboxypeptidase-like regulatory domain-containing protein [Isosphaeraceae bacterium]
MPEIPASRFRYSIQGLMVLVVFAALIFAWINWVSRPRPFPVSGTVTFNGQPLSGGRIILVPSTASGQQATGQFVAGRYTVTTFSTNDGALPGTYSVVIVSPGVPMNYQSQATSGLTVQIQKSTNTIDFDLR